MILLCKICGEKINIFPSRAKKGLGKYCSRSCRDQARRTGEEFICKTCGKTFYRKLNRISRSKDKYCSFACRKNRVNKVCETCGKHYSVIPALSKSKFCSISCAKTGDKCAFYKHGLSQTKEYLIQRGHKRRALENGAGGNFSIGQWVQLKEAYNLTCPLCGRKEPEIKLCADHIIPISRGGNSNIENIQPLCRICNAKKHTKAFKVAPTGQLTFISI